MSRAWRSDAPVVPRRISQAFDMCEMFGPEVDRALGVEEPTVDRWESGEEVPTEVQVKKIAVLTGFPLPFFYKPMEALLGDGWICSADGCEPLEGWKPTAGHCATCRCEGGER